MFYLLQTLPSGNNIYGFDTPAERDTFLAQHPELSKIKAHDKVVGYARRNRKVIKRPKTIRLDGFSYKPNPVVSILAQYEDDLQIMLEFSEPYSRIAQSMSKASGQHVTKNMVVGYVYRKWFKKKCVI